MVQLNPFQPNFNANPFDTGAPFTTADPNAISSTGPSSGTTITPPGGAAVTSPNLTYVSNPTAGVGDKSAPITQQQLANLYSMPGQPQTQTAISGLPGAFNTNGSPLAGLTSLGPMYQAGLTTAGNTTINTGTTNAVTAAQLAQINALNAQANGQGPSLADVEAQQQTQRNLAATAALAGSQRGSANSALGLRTAQEAAGNAAQAGVQAAVQGRTAEELAAQQQLTGALGTAGGQAAQEAQAQAGLQQGTNLANLTTGTQVNLANAGALNTGTLQQAQQNQQVQLANLQSQLQTGQINAQQYNTMVQAMMTEYQNQLAGQENYGQLVTGENTQLQGIAAGVGINNSNNNMGLAGAGIGALGALGSGLLNLSDKRTKFNIRPGTKSVKSFLNAIAPKSSTFNLMETI